MKELIVDAVTSKHVQVNTAAVVLAAAQENFHLLASAVSPATYGYGLFALALANVALSLRPSARKRRKLAKEMARKIKAPL